MSLLPSQLINLSIIQKHLLSTVRFFIIIEAQGMEEIKDIIDSTLTELMTQLGCQNTSQKIAF